jgi:hypothetical protein
MTMKTYARILDGRVAELLATDQDIATMFNPALQWVDASAIVGIAEGWQFDGSNFTSPPAPPPPPATPTLAELQAQITLLTAQLAVLSKAS